MDRPNRSAVQVRFREAVSAFGRRLQPVSPFTPVHATGSAARLMSARRGWLLLADGRPTLFARRRAR